MTDNSKRHLSRRTMEIATAIATAAAGGAVCYGAVEIGTGWTETGPAPGYFPFYIGLLIILGSLANLGRAFVSRNWREDVFLDVERARPVLAFALPLVGFVIAALLLGLYVATLLYVSGVMIWQGRYRWWAAVLGGAAVAAAFYLVFEIAFQVPLLKGPVEGWLGIY
ncbi:tripartite tricarboxylate transporter TctB family protein [Rhizobium bangladeshense]|uniref:Tripartite tricarboxylate transporter TctB family protein n=1 Tax=Rhizobium bangladeshense TaxID=1138189 RepID=A0ABS7LI93_9HYPH|nr:tripartite tricarboxylate transporter TctB family protein [Rhizobium bangladeshense]MBX4871507.1 tripartite tricarboxylate transporter TctB family protein [Rhizobium bangladeshense]MBX4882821.1 tripartite tricarboxylate transporter TctB family protein [Rhizobium bangladeshense]MBY3591197.1 tripartite tricarboxylate transporter TctB family protein [Rhizobium bangladeshense]